ncbi:MAG: acyl-CoA thioesterase II [Actinomycetales bacterium]|nr:acyl-CoA thioesterase II [Actinomycetales bacterium]
MPAAGDSFLDRLTLDRVDRDIFTGTCHSGAPLRAYGGQIAAQSLMAAGTTVDAPGRTVHSLHGYFLRPGQTKDTITYLVDRPRDGGSFSTRFVRAVQHGETIFMMTASFAVLDPGPEHQFAQPPAPPPEGLTSTPLVLTIQSDPQSMDYPAESLIDLRPVNPADAATLRDGRYEWLAWIRATEQLPDDPLVQACALAYLSDLTMVRTAISPHPQEAGALQLASIDHAMWFHASARADDWLLFAQDTPVARAGHGLARGLIFSPVGTLVASVVQESLMRTRRAVSEPG